MNEWTHAPVFGRAPLEGAAVVRPSAYGLIVDGSARLAVVRAPQGHFLPGGGIEPGEEPHQALVREAGEECGLRVQVGAWGLRAIDFVYSEAERRRFEKRSGCGSFRVAAKVRRNSELPDLRTRSDARVRRPMAPPHS
jgi:8-oxo-dGTP pyrophosphatase MutT (NUDIX family)